MDRCLSEQEMHLISLFRSLDAGDRAEIVGFAEAFVLYQKK